MKVHVHDEQFDGVPHPWCGRGATAVTSLDFEATSPALRCRACAREWFPHGQPDWHHRGAVERLAQAALAGSPA